MKKMIMLLISVAMLFSLLSCTESNKDFQSPVRFYYPRVECTFGKSDSVLAGEVHEAGSHAYDLTYLLEQYLKGPEDDGLYSPFPAGTKLVRLEQNGRTLNIILDSTFAELTGLKLTLACAGLTKTCLELADIDIVQISADGPTLDGERSIIMDRQTLELLDQAVNDMTAPTQTQEAI